MPRREVKSATLAFPESLAPGMSSHALRLFLGLAVLSSIGTWWVVLVSESRDLAEKEMRIAAELEKLEDTAPRATAETLIAVLAPLLAQLVAAISAVNAFDAAPQGSRDQGISLAAFTDELVARRGKLENMDADAVEAVQALLDRGPADLPHRDALQEVSSRIAMYDCDKAIKLIDRMLPA